MFLVASIAVETFWLTYMHVYKHKWDSNLVQNNHDYFRVIFSQKISK